MTRDRAPFATELIQLALSQRGKDDDQFGAPGFRIYFGGQIKREYGPYLPRLWSWCVALKTVVCIILGLGFEEDDWWQDQIEIAIWDGDEHNGYPEANYHEWSYLKVLHGWRPSTWRFDHGRESS